MNTLFQIIPKEGAQVLLVLFLAFLIGLEREEHKVAADQYGFGGVRTFPLIGLFGYALMLVSGGTLALTGVGLAVVGAFLWLSYKHKLGCSAFAGMTTEISGLVTYAIGALVYREEYWIATTLTVIAVVLLELKKALEGLTQRVPGEEILTFAKFLLLTAVILPIVPNRTFGNFGFNPFKTWLVVVAVSAISYGSYLLQKVTGGRGGVLLAALLGGAYSSTITTVVLAKKSKYASQPHLYAGSTLVASGMMYLRLLALIAIFSHALLLRLRWPFLVLATVGMLGGWAWTRLTDAKKDGPIPPPEQSNPLELRSALVFGVLFVAVLYVTRVALVYLGQGGLYALAAVMGITDVDPFILSLTQSAGTLTSVALAAAGISIAAVTNNIAKGAYFYGFSDRRTGVQALMLLLVLSVLGLLPLIW